MIETRFLLGFCALLVSGGAALAQDPCKPVETAPGIKSVPAGCNKVLHRDVTGAVAKPYVPTGRPSVLFPDNSSGAVMKFGDTEVRVNGRVRFETQIGN